MGDDSVSKSGSDSVDSTEDSIAVESSSAPLAKKESSDYDDLFFGNDDRQQFVIDALTNSLRDEITGAGVDTSQLRNELLHWVQEAVRREPKRIGGILLPIIGPMIRQMIADRLQAFMENTTAMLDLYASPNGLKLRLQSLKTGIPLSRLILLNMFVFRVDSVMLIHSKTDLMVKDVYRHKKPLVDPDAIGAMLTAISKFIDDSFGIDDGTPIKDIRLGDYHVWLFSGPIVNLACIVYGNPDTRSRRQIVSVLEDVHAVAGASLRDFPNSPVDEDQLEELLQRCLVERRDQSDQSDKGEGNHGDLSETSNNDSSTLRGVALALGLFVTGLVAWQVQTFRWDQRVDQVEELLNLEPGMVPIKMQRDGKELTVTVMMDSSADIPYQEIAEIGFPPNKLSFVTKPYISTK